jgi:hypothetical protein
MSIGPCQIGYTPAGGPATTLTFNYPPVDFMPYFDARVHDNLSTDGSVRERVSENALGDILISFQMPNMILSVDLQAWARFEAFALAGGQFTFSPNTSLGDVYDCVLEDKSWKPKRNAPAKYAATVTIRVLQDSHAPADPSQVLRRFYGIST